MTRTGGGDPLAGLSAREREVMDIVLRLQEATAAQVEEELADPPSNATVRSILRTLEEKGWLEHTRDGATFVYRPTQQRTRVATHALRHLARTFFDDSPVELVSALLGSTRSLSPEEREEMAKLLRTLDGIDDDGEER